ncbi:hypothetical protein XENOCAPTIV_019222 [Xenoophorus captivus]|uniref:C2H2-type domain-containing protein n=1 Tax=Xenoophorus captivus TaxID=1517983 RepID=A0ABV0R467_9TELE
MDRCPVSHPAQQEKSHIARKHTNSPRKKPEQDAKPRVRPRGWTCGECLQWFAERESYVSHIRNSHGKGIISASPVGDTRADSPDRIDLDAHSAKRLKTQLRCSKCGFITDDSTEFQQHIPQHKTDDNTPQCLRWHFMGKKSVDGSLLETVFENINAPSEGRDVSPVARLEDVQALITKMWRGAQQTRKHTLDIEGEDPA